MTVAVSPLDAFIPDPQVRERFQVTIEAPAELVMEVAEGFDLQSLTIVRGIFWMRERLMGAPGSGPREVRGLRAEMLSLGWGVLEAEPGRLLMCGAACQPWLAEVRFRPVAPRDFPAFAEPNQVKIAWTLEAESLGPTTTRFIHETRVVPTDTEAAARFGR